VTLRAVPSQVTSGSGWHVSGSAIVVDTAGAVLENVTTNLSIEVQANNVTVRNVRSSASGETWAIALRHASGAVISNVEILPPSSATRLMVGIKDVYGDAKSTQVLRSEITRTSTGVQMGGGLIEGNYIHDMGLVSGDHINGVTSNGSTTQLTIRNNTILNQFSQTDAISFFQDFGVEANRTVSGNLIAGGGYTLYGGEGTHGQTSNIVVVNNRFARLYFPNGGYYGPAAHFEAGAPGNVWSGNIWDDTLAPVPTP